MPSYIGLYYPFIHFKDDWWLKLAALYWDKMGRIVPTEYGTRDSETVKRLADELGFIENFAPGAETKDLGERFLALLQQHEAKLRARYGVSQSDQWQEDPITKAAAPPGSDAKFAYIFYEKMWPELQDALVNTGLAQPERAGDPRWVGMHPRVASVYMTALAEEIAANRGLHPTTDECLAHVAVSGATLERLAQALLEDVKLTGPASTQHEIEVQMATVALESVIPRNIKSVPVEKIISLRKKHPAALATFQDYLNGLVAEMRQLQEVKDAPALKTHLEAEYEKKLKPELDALRARLRSLQVDAVTGAFNMQFSIPPLAATGATALGLDVNPLLALGGGFALGLIPVLRDKQKQAREAVKSSPAAWLMRAEENLKPATLSSWVRTSARQFILGV